jgi:hypothetical protein
MRVQIKTSDWVEMKRSVALRIAKLQAEGRCLACGEPLGNGKVVRGCHERCARATYRAIWKRKTTDAQRVEDGKWLPPAQAGRKPSNPVSVELSE